MVDTVAERDWICVLGVFDLPLNDELFTFAFGWDEISDEKMLIVDIFDEGVRSGCKIKLGDEAFLHGKDEIFLEDFWVSKHLCLRERNSGQHSNFTLFAKNGR